MDFIAQYGLFTLKALTFVIAILITFAGVLAISKRSKTGIQIDSLNETYAEQKKHLKKCMPSAKAEKKSEKKQSKKEHKKKQKNKEEAKKPTRFVLTFHGDITASEVEQLRDEISMILSLATPKDEVVLRLESPGGAVSGYGLAASQLERLRDKKIPLTVCIDKIAASGGYLMASVANKVIAAPFAVIGSIGVVAQIPNFYRLLKKNNIDIELLTAGKYKRTLTMVGQNTPKAREKFQEDLEAVHQMFQNHVLAYRKNIDIAEVATGEHWLAKDTINLKLGLVDALKTSDDYLYDDIEAYNTLLLSTPVKQDLKKKLFKPLSALFYPAKQHL